MSGLLIAIIGAVIGAVITAFAILYQTHAEVRRTKRSIAVGLFWEIDDFNRSHIQNTHQALERADPTQLGYYVRTPYKGFTVYESTADRIGLFPPETVKAIVLFYGSARGYLSVVEDYGQAIERVEAGQSHRSKAVTLLALLKTLTAQMIPLISKVCELLEKEADSN
jgi:hypothetical protein